MHFNNIKRHLSRGTLLVPCKLDTYWNRIIYSMQSNSEFKNVSWMFCLFFDYEIYHLHQKKATSSGTCSHMMNVLLLCIWMLHRYSPSLRFINIPVSSRTKLSADFHKFVGLVEVVSQLNSYLLFTLLLYLHGLKSSGDKK